MKSASGGLIAHLNSSQQLIMADLYTFTLVGGFVARHTANEGNLVVGGNTFTGSGTGPIFTRSRTRTVIGVEVDTLDVTVAPSPSHTLNGTPWLTATRNGALDGARLKLERCFLPSWGDTSLGTTIMFSGRVADIEAGRTHSLIHVHSDLELLNVMLPRNLYQPGCLNTLFDGACTLVKSSWGIGSTVASGGSKSVINCGLAQASGYFDLGTITFTSGVNNGVSRSVKSYTPGVLNLMLPLITAPTVGDSFTAYGGCDKQQATCANKFGNLLNFRGFPYVPAPESIL